MLGQVVAAQSLGIHAGGYPATDPPHPRMDRPHPGGKDPVHPGGLEAKAPPRPPVSEEELRR